MFQYAAGRRLSAILRVPLQLDLSGFRTYRLHGGFRLDRFRLPKEVSFRRHSSLASLLLGQGSTATLLRKGASAIGWTGPKLVRERHFHFDPQILLLGDGIYLDGYWQSPKYFNEIEEVVRGEFKVRCPLAGKNLELAEMIEDCTSVSLHVRRGDYVADAHTSRYHGTCGPEYYERAIAVVRQRVGNPHIFIFSDDPEWAETNLRFPFPTTVLRHNAVTRGEEDLRLLSLCRHHIIANSTFSWWGAWLCSNRTKVVVAPQKWFQDASHSTIDLIPDEWVRV
ncbi:MAG: alpha-1,2-fucosyltransferase [Burkholderiales bacterium]